MYNPAQILARLTEAGTLTKDQAFDIEVMWAHQDEDRCDCEVCVTSKRLIRKLGLQKELK